MESWTAGVQRQLGRGTVVQVDYIGTHSLHELARHNIAQPLPISSANLPYCQADPTDVTHDCPTSTRLPYPNFTGFFINSDFNGYAHYNAMNVTLTHRTTNLMVTAAYTWAQSKDDKSAAAGVGATGSGYQGFMNNHDPKLDYGLSDFDVPQRFVASYIYQLPFGRGQRYGAKMNRAEDLALGGWQLAGITTFQSGFPFSITATDAAGLLDTQFQRANYQPGCDVHAHGGGRFDRINMSCFSQPAIGVFGNSKRNFLHQPGLNNWDMGLQKSFQLVGRMRFHFRVDTFNTFNHHQYVVNVGGLATGGSGGGAAISNGVGGNLAGQITSAGPARIIQFSGKISF